jgi:type VI secretion system protein ImpG
MEFTRYFQNELAELRKLYDDAAQRNPALASFLKTPSLEADIGRLTEGFAFLAALLRQKLDDDLPEVIQGLFRLLWPNYLRPIPAASIIQYQPDSNTTGLAVVPKGTPVESVPVDGTPWRFRTVYETEILPLRVDEQQFFVRMNEVILAVTFTLTSGTLRTLPLSRLRFFFTGKKSVSHTLYLTLLRKVREIRFVLRDKEKKEHIADVLHPDSITPVGFREEEGLCPYPKNTLVGYRILQEYFCFPEKFLFVEINGLETGIRGYAGRNFPDATEFELHFILKELPEEYEAFHVENWQLFCTPVINLFPMTSAPLRPTKQCRDYRIIPDHNLRSTFPYTALMRYPGG